MGLALRHVDRARAKGGAPAELEGVGLIRILWSIISSRDSHISYILTETIVSFMLGVNISGIIREKWYFDYKNWKFNENNLIILAMNIFSQ